MRSPIDLTRKEKKALKSGRVAGIYDALLRLTEACPKPYRATSSWNYIVNSEMSGLPIGCSEFSCRDRNLLNTSAFASLYADQVVLSNPLSFVARQYLRFEDSSDEIFVDDGPAALREIYYAISCIVRLKPLIESGVATFVDFEPASVCGKCLDEGVRNGLQIPNGSGFAFIDSYQSLMESNIVTVERVSSDSITLGIKGIGGPQCSSEYYFYAYDEKYLNTLKHHKIGQVLAREEIHALELFRESAEVFCSDLTARNQVKSRFDIGTIFSNSLEIDVMQKVFGDKRLSKVIDLKIPFCSTSQLNRLVELREKERASFQEFRNLFSSLELRPDMDRLEALDKVDKQIIPILSELQRKIASWRRDQRNSIIDSSAVSIVSLGVAAMSAPTSLALSGIVTLLAGGHFSKAMVPPIRKLFQEPEDAQSSQMYFAWKAQQLLDAK